ncbi:MAG: aminotransferase class I/II-fold pyridoxal phosphate-dependent enzyme [Candidatus Peribacteraceae bacterium]|nr:aminotransferase class I/II-fold pyridoxal phosphate-dependent enzyme [Candidatus Peribacteraceae bacterium]MDD5739994.1 aminotransferase class I/II-fold pyridoxal phosphate-dependent enzyme [Candidatus Peribacteraceae bacterium]
MPLFHPIHHTFAPHVNAGYVLRTLGLLFQPWKWEEGSEREALRSALAQKFDADVFLFASGREALAALFKALKGPPHAEVIVQAYTCVVVPNAIHAASKTPVYADIERESLNLSVEDVERRLTPRTQAIICQHTFGIPSDTHKLRALCDRYGLLLIEDCAHVIPDESGPATIGKDGDFLLFSFGRDKAISGITGGAILSRRPDVSVRLTAEEGAAASLSLLQIKRLLLYPLVYAIARPLYGIGLGKGLLILARTLGALVPILTKEEKQGCMSPTLHRLPNVCAALALGELKRLRKINDHRRKLTALYLSEIHNQLSTFHFPLSTVTNRQITIPKSIHASLPLQKFPLFVHGANVLRHALKKRNIHLNDGWTGCVVCPAGTALDEVSYKRGLDPEAEQACEQILSLPTHPTMTERDAKRLIETLTSFKDDP